ncbi:MAG: E3 binding domain-containing protein, partial [Caldilineaceae bacterium]|nr:E3 binding domain-containing protein [Caldilineaceae bacterium]
MTVEIKVPEMGESVVEATVARWIKQEGDAVKAGEAVVELETDKVNVEVAAEVDGVLAQITQPEGADVKIGDVLAVINRAGEGAEPAPAAPSTQQPATDEREEGQRNDQPAGQDEADERVTPVAKRLAADKGVDLAAVSPSQPGGRVTKQDVEQHLRAQQPSGPAPQPSAPTTQSPASSLYSPDPRGETRERMSRRRRTIAERLVQAQQTAAMLTTFNEIDMSA